MKFKRNKFSATEQRVLQILGRKKMTILEITEELKLDNLDGNNRVATCIRRINRKCEYYKLTWHLEGEGTGRHGRKVWRSKSSA